MKKLVIGASVAAAGLAVAGLGLAGVASAAPVDPSPASTAPASAGPAPVPLVYQPVDASDGLYGMRRGSVPTASTEQLAQMPIVNRLPVVGVTPLPARDTDDEQATEAADGTATDGSDGAPGGSGGTDTDSGTDSGTVESPVGTGQ